MSKSSLDYAELNGLDIALVRLKMIPIEYQDEEYIAVVEWIQERIAELKKL